MQSIKSQLALISDLRKVFEYVANGNIEAGNILIYIKANYKEWEKMIIWLKRNNIRGQQLVDFFKNESDTTGGGYLLGSTLILSRIKGHKNTLVGVKIDELI